MKLRTATGVMLGVAGVSLVLSLIIGITSWNAIQRNIDRADAINLLHEQVYEVREMIDAAALVERTPRAVGSAARRAEALIDPTWTRVDLTDDVQSVMRELVDLTLRIESDLDDDTIDSAAGPAQTLDHLRALNSLDARLLTVLLESEKQAERETRDLLSDAALRLVVALVLLAVLTFLFSAMVLRRSYGPLNALTSAISAAGRKGQYALPEVKIERSDEFGQLADAFNALSQRANEQSREVHAARERFELLAETVDDLFWIFDVANNEPIYLSPAFESLYGFRPDIEKLSPEFWLQRIPEKDQPGYLRFIEGWQYGVSEGKYRFRRPDDRVVWVHDKAYPIFDDDGELVRTVGVARDVTSLVESQHALEQRARQQEVLYDASSAMARARDSVGAICQSIIDRLPDLVEPDRKGAACIELGGDRYATQNWGASRWTIRAPIVMQGAEEGVIHLGCMSRAVGVDARDSGFFRSELNSLEVVAANMAALLHGRRIESRLWQDQKLRAVGELTGGVAHDFNNLLTVILGNAELVLEGLDEDSPDRDLIDMILQASTHAADLTARLLAFARRQPLDPETIDLNELLDEMVPIIRRTIGEEISINVDLEDELWATRVDRSQLSAALLNLAINARDAMPEGGELFIETHNQLVSHEEADEFLELAAGEYAVVAVADDGAGISEEDQKHVFEPFFTTKPKTAGTGLGLSMVYGFTKQSGGNVTMYSELGKGTTIRLYLPRDEHRSEQARETERDEFDGDGLRVLLAEDDALVRSYAERLLTSLGFEVVSTENADEALIKLESDGRFDILLTDVVMPGSMDGIGLADRAIAIDPELVALYMSGYTRDRFSKKKELDPDAILLNKPFRRNELVGVLHRVWSRKKSDRGGKGD